LGAPQQQKYFCTFAATSLLGVFVIFIREIIFITISLPVSIIVSHAAKAESWTRVEMSDRFGCEAMCLSNSSCLEHHCSFVTKQ
jgi:hypothetical protein